MTATTLIAGSAIFALGGAAYLYVGRRVGQRRAVGPSHRATQSFAWWWYAFGGLNLLAAVLSAAFAVGVEPGAVVTDAAVYLTIGLYAIAFFGIIHYLLYLFTGWAGSFRAVAGVMLVYALVLAGAVYRANPSGLVAQRWQVIFDFENQDVSFSLLMLPLSIAPAILSLAYFRLFFKLDDRTRRYRVALVAGSILVFFGASVALAGVGLAGDDTVQIVFRFLGLAAAGAVLAAYSPPTWVRRRFGIRSLAEEVVRTDRAAIASAREAGAAERDAAFHARVRDLI